LKKRTINENLSNVFLQGKVKDELQLYYRASNVMLIPGRGGIVISEAMAFGLPVIVHQADGTEHDLIQNEATGFRLSEGKLSEFQSAIEFLRDNPKICLSMGNTGKQLIMNSFNTDNMIKQIMLAASYAKKSRSKKMGGAYK
jgi:glycosyltransferase involved in cell wall biosynthesis